MLHLKLDMLSSSPQTFSVDNVSCSRTFAYSIVNLIILRRFRNDPGWGTDSLNLDWVSLRAPEGCPWVIAMANMLVSLFLADSLSLHCIILN